MKNLPRKTSLACLLALVALAPSGFSEETDDPSISENNPSAGDKRLWRVEIPADPNCTWIELRETGGWVEVCPSPGIVLPIRRTMFKAQTSCDNEHLLLIDEEKGKLLAQHALEPGEELEEVVNVTPSEVTVIVNNDNTDALLAQFQTFLSQNPTWGQLAPGAIEAQVVTASGHFPDLKFGTPSGAAAFDKWYEEVYSGPLPEPSEEVRTYRINKTEKALEVVAQRLFKESDAEQLVNRSTSFGPGGISRAKRTYITAKVSNDGTTLELQRYAAYRTAVRVPPR